MRVVLEVVQGAQSGRRFEFDRHDTFMVGRSRKAHFPIPDDPWFSRHQFMIEADPPRCFLRDMGSTNGTKVNDEKVREKFLNDGDVITAGRTRIVVRVFPDPVPTPEDRPVVPVGPPSPPKAPEGAATRVTLQETAPEGPAAPIAARLHCASCGKLAVDTALGGLADTRMVTYVCKDCRQRSRAPHRPIPNYEVLGELGRGALGTVYKAKRLSSDKMVALKMIPPEMAANPRAVQLFLREMTIGASLDHPRIAAVVEIGDAGGDLWIASELVDGVDAARLAAQQGGRLDPPDAVAIVCQVLDALQYAHDHNLVHRDVKPANILVTGSPGRFTAKLGDFGLMKNMDEAGMTGITRRGEVRGTVPFMPPEQVLDCRFVKPAGDLYQAGVTLYWLLTGRFPYDFEARDRRGETKDPFVIILEDPIIPIGEGNPSVPPSVAKVLETALRKEPEDRFETAAQMAAMLRAAIPDSAHTTF